MYVFSDLFSPTNKSELIMNVLFSSFTNDSIKNMFLLDRMIFAQIVLFRASLVNKRQREKKQNILIRKKTFI